MSLRTLKISLGRLAVVGVLVGSVCQADAAQEPQSLAQNAYQSPITAASRVQVTGTPAKMSVDTERADVQSVLKAALKLAGKQFIPDASVSGQVTLLLTDQPLDTVLRAICQQTYLRYSIGPDGIYRFSRDDDAIKQAFNNLFVLNGQLRQQLRNLGLDLPPDAALNELAKKESNLQTSNKPAEPGGLASGSALNSRIDARQRTGELRKDESTETKNESQAAKVNRSATLARPSASVKSLEGNTQANALVPNGAHIHTNYLTQDDLDRFMDSHGSTISPQQYQIFLRQNGLVWFNIPEEKPQPVSIVIQDFSRQANVPVLIDQTIPNSLKFRVWGTLSPRQLPEALNVLAPTAHLQWRWIGNSIFVFPAPDFQVYFAANPTSRNSARYIYPGAQSGAIGGGAPSGPAAEAGADAKNAPAGSADDSKAAKSKPK